jgi:hypothetical protein
MKSKNVFLSITSFVLLFTFNTIGAQTAKQTSSPKKESNIEVIQFHSEHRCMTCNKIESMARETVKTFPDITFSLVNVDDKKNAAKAEQFEAAGTALFVYNRKTGKKKDLTDFAFMNAGNKEKFMAGLKKEINQFEN